MDQRNFLKRYSWNINKWNFDNFHIEWFFMTVYPMNFASEWDSKYLLTKVKSIQQHNEKKRDLKKQQILVAKYN